MKRYTTTEILRAAELGEVSMIDARHIVSLLDEARTEPSGSKELAIQIKNYNLEMPFVPKAKHNKKGHEKPYKFHR